MEGAEAETLGKTLKKLVKQKIIAKMCQIFERSMKKSLLHIKEVRLKYASIANILDEEFIQ